MVERVRWGNLPYSKKGGRPPKEKETVILEKLDDEDMSVVDSLGADIRGAIDEFNRDKEEWGD